MFAYERSYPMFIFKDYGGFIGICYYCREDVYENELVIHGDRPFHKKCIKDYTRLSKFE